MNAYADNYGIGKNKPTVLAHATRVVFKTPRGEIEVTENREGISIRGSRPSEFEFEFGIEILPESGNVVTVRFRKREKESEQRRSKTPCAIDGFEGKVHALKMCGGHHGRWNRTGDPLNTTCRKCRKRFRTPKLGIHLRCSKCMRSVLKKGIHTCGPDASAEAPQ